MKSKIIFILGAVALLLWQCKKAENEDVVTTNPFDDPSLQPPDSIPDTSSLEVGSFEYLHAFIFKPTCANSGCHDGNFDPDFRTIYSSYNTMVLQTVIQNDPQMTYTYRVEPGNAEKSLLHARLTTFLPETSGIMPLTVEPESDWEDKKQEYIQYIIDWINDGAKDPFGNTPSNSSLYPQVSGIKVFHSGTTSNPLSTVEGSGNPIGIPNSSIDVWLAFTDDKTPSASLSVNELYVSTDVYDFANADKKILTIETPITEKDFFGNDVSYTHKTTLDFPTDTIGSYFFLRTKVNDEDHTEPVEIPNEGSSDILRGYFTLKVDSL